jgi:hypothetical protein
MHSSPRLAQHTLGMNYEKQPHLCRLIQTQNHTSILQKTWSCHFIWLIRYLYSANTPYVWKLANKEKDFQALCDRPPTALANMHIGIPSVFEKPYFALFDRIWVETMYQSGCFIPSIKCIGLGFNVVLLLRFESPRYPWPK